MIIKSEKSIRAQIVRTLGALGLAVFALTAVGLYLIYDAKDPVQNAMRDYERNHELVSNARVALDQVKMEYTLFYGTKGEVAAAHLENARLGTSEFLQSLEKINLQVRGGAAEIKQDVEKIRQRFSDADSHEKVLAAGYLNGTATGVGKFSSAAAFDEMRVEVLALNAKFLAQFERDLARTLKSLVFLIVPVLLGLLIIPLTTFWAATRKINRDLLCYIRSLYNYSEQNEQSSEELRLASELVSGASSQQSAAIQQTVSSIAQIRTMLAETETHVREVQALTTEMNEETIAGREIMERLEKSMQAIEETNSQIVSFEEILNSIRGKTQVINDIVFKTQLLSFNASIEAARAGHYGRGFSVVAEEVGKLAMMSGDAAREIDLLLGQSADRVSRIVDSVRDRLGDGKTVSNEALAKFGYLTTRLTEISEKIDQVANATTEQGGGIEQTAKAMEQVNLGASENKRGAEAVHRIADRVFDLSAKIREVTSGIRRFVREEKRGGKFVTAPTVSESESTSAEQNSNESETTASVAKVRASQRSAGPREAASASKPASTLTLAYKVGKSKKVGDSPRTTKSIKEISADDPSFKKVGSAD